MLLERIEIRHRIKLTRLKIEEEIISFLEWLTERIAIFRRYIINVFTFYRNTVTLIFTVSSIFRFARFVDSVKKVQESEDRVFATLRSS